MIVKPPVSSELESLEASCAELMEAGFRVDITSETTPTTDVMCPFLYAMDQEARIAVRCGEAYMPTTPGWDQVLIALADRIEDNIFVARWSEHRTRYYTSIADVLAAPEPIPVVSVGWLRACGGWSPAGVSPALFQTLVWFYFEQYDWVDKHRPLRFFPVNGVAIEPWPSTSELAVDFGPISPHGLPNAEVPEGIEELARAKAVEIHAKIWCEQQRHEGQSFRVTRVSDVLQALSDTDGSVAREWSLAPIPRGLWV